MRVRKESGLNGTLNATDRLNVGPERLFKGRCVGGICSRGFIDNLVLEIFSVQCVFAWVHVWHAVMYVGLLKRCTSSG